MPPCIEQCQSWSSVQPGQGGCHEYTWNQTTRPPEQNKPLMTIQPTIFRMNIRSINNSRCGVRLTLYTGYHHAPFLDTTQPTYSPAIEKMLIASMVISLLRLPTNVPSKQTKINVQANHKINVQANKINVQQAKLTTKH